ncbi:hypothetical protein VFPPC_13756 [Pochonia chlamydosporia 170]|uniref:Uncharacterized protein n=1 Tax=Pochonia chlamydosporia 170 TaxID=1380566 RepID=A0A179FV13_METCM|nr:hypothetical protein VFPPC_13756 [Pochonia chlamydosporia 170]OAQ68913.1 hypothetical protein VFPPC_13756 [Pochonia chlamydosporia 170]
MDSPSPTDSPTRTSPSGTPQARQVKCPSTSPPTTVIKPPATINIKKEEQDEAFPIQSIDVHDPGYESSVDLPFAQLTDVQLELEEEKRSYPGASTWAEEEEQLFEILFKRGDIPLVPAHWDVDFRGIPVVESIFSTTDDMPPIIYSRSTDKEFQATMALIRLIDLTSSVRTTVQSGLRQKAPQLIKKSLDKYVAWAAEDGGYSNLRIVPNITTAVMDAELGEKGITSTIERRMRALAMAQREFLRVNRDESFWDVSEVENAAKHTDWPDLLVEKYVKRIEEQTAAASKDGSCQSTPIQPSTSPKDTTTTGESTRSPDAHGLVSDETHQSLLTTVEYRQKPPVVYGLFILRTSVFVLTVDSAKGDSAYVSFHVDMHFMDRHQSVWNALTAAIAVCLARDQLVERMDEFDELPAREESGSEA